MSLSVLFPLFLFLFLVPSPSSSATFDTSQAITSTGVSLDGFLCADTDSIPKSTSVSTTFSPNISFSYPGISIDVGFEYQSGVFPLTLEVDSYCLPVDVNLNYCLAQPLLGLFETSEQLNNFVYQTPFFPGTCPDVTGPSIRCVVTFCSYGESDITFRATMSSLAQETLFPSDESISLPGPTVDLENGEDLYEFQLFTFENSKDKGEFVLSLSDSSSSINEYFSSLTVNGDTRDLDDVDESTYSVEVKEEINYFSLFQSNTTADVEGSVKFKTEDDDFNVEYVIVGVVAGIVVFFIVGMLVYFLAIKKSDQGYEEVA